MQSTGLVPVNTRNRDEQLNSKGFNPKLAERETIVFTDWSMCRLHTGLASAFVCIVALIHMLYPLFNLFYHWPTLF